MPNSQTYTPATHDYFDDLVVLFVSLASVETAITSYANGGVTTAPSNRNNAIHMGGRVATYSFHTHELMHGISRDQWPAHLTVFRFPSESPPEYHPNNQDLYNNGLHRLVGSIFGSFFLKWYEQRSDNVKSSHGRDPLRWPESWRFAWLIRNAIAHGDRFTIYNPAFQATTWRGITVTQSDSGRLWFDIDGGFLAGGDVLELVNDLHLTQVATGALSEG